VIDFEVQRCTRRCAVTNKPFEPGEAYVSLLRSTGAGHEKVIERLDFGLDQWHEPEADSATTDGVSAEVIGWWRSRMPGQGEAAAKLAPNEVLLGLLDAWADDPQRDEARYVLALLLVRRKVLRIAEDGLQLDQSPGAKQPADQTDRLRVSCPSRDEFYELPVMAPSEERIRAIQAELNELLYADSK